MRVDLSALDSPKTATAKPLHQIWQLPEMRLMIAILIVILILSSQSDAFLTLRNFRSILVGFSFVGIAALGQLLVVLTGRIDLSSGSAMGVSGVITALALTSGANPVLALAAGLGTGAVIGIVNALFSVSLSINSFIVTLGSLQMARGVAIALAGGQSISGFPESFLDLGATYGGLPLPAWILLALSISVAAVLRYTSFGREMIAIGGNESAAYLAGVAVHRNIFVAFIVSGILAALAGALMTAHLGAALGNTASGYELTIIASVVIGGASLSGGKGGALGVILGAALIALVNNALVLLTVPTFWQQTFIGAVILGAALIDRIRR